MKKTFTFLFLSCVIVSNGQNVAINSTGAAPAASAMLDVSSTNSGLLIPRMTTAQRGAIAAPATGLLVFDTSLNAFYYYNGSAWWPLLSSGSGWMLTGNSLAGTEFMGSTNAQPVKFYTNNAERMRIFSTGEVVVNSTTAFAGDMFSSYASGTSWGVASYCSGSGVAVYGRSSSTGTGVFAVNSVAGATGRALEVQNTSATNTDIGMGSFHLGNGRAGNFQNNLNTNTSITLFASNSTTQNNSNAAAVWGQSTGIRGVVGLSSLANVNSIGINGQYIGGGAIDAIGVLGLANSSAGWGYGVYGQGNWRALYGNGNFACSGTKAFQIDHPSDPANKFLLHYSIESPEVLNLYRGVVTLDANGEATVTMPSYFTAININFSYELTAIGASMPNLYIDQEMAHGKFKIAGGTPNKKVSWVVYAERNDEWVKQNPSSKIVELNKKPHEQGKYTRPELYGASQAQGIFNVEQSSVPNANPGASQKED